ncbi:MAG: type I restriction endonuclease subunit R [Gammaproteobacteria bacterium]|nr:type I restriction endonuclease subunit R [Gammaproteobacteria bacterium]
MTLLPKFQEEYSAKIPALTLLHHLGWRFLSAEQTLSARNEKTSEVVLRDVLRDELRKRRFTYAGKERAFSENAIDNVIAELCSPALNEGLNVANEKIYNHLLYGISVREFIDGKRMSPTLQIIDWSNVNNNSFLFTEELSVLRTNGVESRRPDIVCFVNGFPLVVIEAKRPDGHAGKGPTIDEGISQNIRNQRNDEIPHLFAYTQLLFSINGAEGRYGTQGTPQKFWSPWREEDIHEGEFCTLKNKALSSADKETLFSHRPKQDREWYENLIAGGELAVTDQDRLLISLISPARLLEMIRFYVLFDKKFGKVAARYPQVFAIKRLLERIHTKNSKGARQGGVIWHTTGSGKSLTMVFLSKSLILHDALKQCRIIVVTDRVDLEDQLSKTFSSGGELASKKDKEAAIATSGKRLADQIAKGNERIIFTLINKFAIAAKMPECHNPSSDIIVLVDEGHRSQGGENYIRMCQALPNAAFVAFTGTPLLKDDKTENKFGSIIHAYTMQSAVEDKTVTPLLYEERIPDLDVNDRAIDRWFERITEGLTEDQKTDLKKKFAKKGSLYQSEDRIRLIAYDIANHFVKNIDDGLKGQLACDSKLSAIKYKQFMDELALFESAIVMSAPDTREGNTDVDETTMPEVTKWWKENVGSEEGKAYTKKMVKRFDEDDDLKILIVVDKLLTGFDEPKNTVLYIDKPLKEHNLIQAIARVNRLHPKKKFGLLIDYRGILAELDTTIAKYQDLANRTQGGFDLHDIEGLYQQMSTEYKKLPGYYKDLWAIFKEVKNKGDIEQLRQVIIPRMQGQYGAMLDVNLKVREDFYDCLSEFANCLKVALQSASFYEDKSFTEKDRAHYKETVKQFSSLRQLAQADAGETIDYDEYADQVKKLMDKHVVGVEIKESDGVYEVGKMGRASDPKTWSEEKTRNETDIIKTRVTRMIEQSLRDDPYAQEVFSKLLKQVIEEAEALFDHPLKQYMLFSAFEEKVENREVDDLPDKFSDNKHAQAYYGLLKMHVGENLSTFDDALSDRWVTLSFKVDEIITNAIAEHSINPQNIEAEIRKNLLPMIFAECKKTGSGMDQAKIMIECVVQIVREGKRNSQ